MVECARIQHFPKDPKQRYEYGTAGFRMKANLMEVVAYRVGLYMASIVKEEGAIGVMITASHNPVEDNGIKLVAETGEMMEGIEEEVTKICNMDDEELLVWMANQTPSKSGTILVGRDTRPSGPALVEALRIGIQSLNPNIRVKDCGLVTTPQLHHYVASFNAGVEDLSSAYYSMLVDGFNTTKDEDYSVDLVVDCANGIGAQAMSAISKNLKGLNIQLINSGEGQLNHECGADYVKLTRSAPVGTIPHRHKHYASLDGDADRVVFWFFDEEGRFQLLDGDRIAILIAETLQATLKGSDLRMGVVQTAYANGGSTAHLRKIGVETVMTLTGVKNLHHEARHYDIGIYFEANGHGTVLLADRAKEALKGNPLIGMVNQYVGDALSDLLLVEAILRLRKMSLPEWNAGYTELPSVQLKVPVKDRTAITTTNADQTVLTPAGLQAELDRIIAEYPEGRAFIRPSGTESIVRVYAEAATPEAAKELADRASATLLHFL